MRQKPILIIILISEGTIIKSSFELLIGTCPIYYLLPAGELELGPPEGLDDGGLVLVVGSHAHERLSDPDASDGALGLAESAPHPRLETIGAGARQHLVDAQHVKRMDADSDVELILGRVLHHVLKTISRDLMSNKFKH